MKMARIRLLLILSIALIITTRCQWATTPDSQPETATPVLIPTLAPGDGSDLLDHLLEDGRLRVGIRVWPEAEFSPPVFRDVTTTDTGGALTGFEVEVVRLVAVGLGLELELIEADPQILVSGSWADKWDIAIASLTPVDQPLPNTPAQHMVYTIPYAFIPMGYLIPIDKEEINEFGDLAEHSVGVLEYSIHQRLLTPGGSALTVQQQTFMLEPPDDIQLVIVSNLQKSIRELGQTDGETTAQLDALFGPTPMFEQAIGRDLPIKLAPQAERVGLQPVAIAAVPRDDLQVDRLIQEINQILLRLREQGILAEISQQWYNQDLSRVR
ncbi:MAG: transporter substrate-binding domain-containing protein [Anaerolineae bacterium]|nr:transporter substrate-binding domain-containing protein [Anaerolineae bacterium]